MSLFETLRNLFASEGPEDRQFVLPSTEEATAALLVEAATVDNEYSSSEQAAVQESLRDGFGLTDAETAELYKLAKARNRQSTQIFPLTYTINQEMEPHHKQQVIELLWSVVLADGRIDVLEKQFMRRVVGLLGVSDKDSALARQVVQTKNTELS